VLRIAKAACHPFDLLDDRVDGIEPGIGDAMAPVGEAPGKSLKARSDTLSELVT